MHPHLSGLLCENGLGYVMGIATKYIPQRATANQTLSSVNTLISRASSLTVHIHCHLHIHKHTCLISVRPSTHTSDVTIPSLMLESVYISLSLSLSHQPLAPCLLLTNKPGRDLGDDFISRMMSWEIRSCWSPLFLHLFFLLFLHPVASSPPRSTPDLLLSHSKEPDLFLTSLPPSLPQTLSRSL